MARVHCSRCGDEIEEGTRPCAYCNVPQSRIGDADASARPASRAAMGCLAVVAVMVLLAVAFGVFMDVSMKQYRVKAKLAKVVSMLDPVKTAITLMRQEQGRLPLVTTVVTAANQGQAVTPDWATLGFGHLPLISQEMRSLRVTPEGDIVVTLVHIKDGIDGTELRATPVPGEHGWSWRYECNSDDDLLRKMFGC